MTVYGTPTIERNYVNGEDAVQFNGSNEAIMRGSNDMPFPGTNKNYNPLFTIAVVFQPLSTIFAGRGIFNYGSYNRQGLSLIGRSNPSQLAIGVQTSVVGVMTTSTSMTSTWRLAVFAYEYSSPNFPSSRYGRFWLSGGTGAGYVDVARQWTTANFWNANQDDGRLCIGANRTGTNPFNYCPVDVAELLIYDYVFDNTDYNNLESDMSTKYGITT